MMILELFRKTSKFDDKREETLRTLSVTICIRRFSNG